MSLFLYRLKRRQRNKLRVPLGGFFTLIGFLLAVPSTVWGSPSGINSQVMSDSLSPPLNVFSSSQKSYEQFLLAVEALYEAVNNGKLTEISRRLTETEGKFRLMSMKEIATAEGIQQLARNITEMKRAVAAISPDKRKWKSDAAALRLAADALAHPVKPLWHQYRPILHEDVIQIKNSIELNATGSGTVPEAALQAFDQMSQHYNVIRTAVLLKSDPWKVERSDSVIRYASRILTADPPNTALWQGIIPLLQEAMDGLFPGGKEAESAFVPPVAAPPWGWSAIMGSFIVTILTWVGWRRYRLDQYSSSGSPSRRTESKDAAERLLERWKQLKRTRRP
jgi:sporulation protein YpjB